mmetsp:Transcript_22570/g.57270  ORF Transcript_22570/g.57270 Transcript_22570/m.57270 type:complete len:257 (+) Transcript_22570:57-827(+)
MQYLIHIDLRRFAPPAPPSAPPPRPPSSAALPPVPSDSRARLLARSVGCREPACASASNFESATVLKIAMTSRGRVSSISVHRGSTVTACRFARTTHSACSTRLRKRRGFFTPSNTSRQLSTPRAAQSAASTRLSKVASKSSGSSSSSSPSSPNPAPTVPRLGTTSLSPARSEDSGLSSAQRPSNSSRIVPLSSGSASSPIACSCLSSSSVAPDENLESTLTCNFPPASELSSTQKMLLAPATPRASEFVSKRKRS